MHRVVVEVIGSMGFGDELSKSYTGESMFCWIVIYFDELIQGIGGVACVEGIDLLNAIFRGLTNSEGTMASKI